MVKIVGNPDRAFNKQSLNTTICMIFSMYMIFLLKILKMNIFILHQLHIINILQFGLVKYAINSTLQVGIRHMKTLKF